MSIPDIQLRAQARIEVEIVLEFRTRGGLFVSRG